MHLLFGQCDEGKLSIVFCSNHHILFYFPFRRWKICLLVEFNLPGREAESVLIVYETFIASLLEVRMSFTMTERITAIFACKINIVVCFTFASSPLSFHFYYGSEILNMLGWCWIDGMTYMSLIKKKKKEEKEQRSQVDSNRRTRACGEEESAGTKKLPVSACLCHSNWCNKTETIADWEIEKKITMELRQREKERKKLEVLNIKSFVYTLCGCEMPLISVHQFILIHLAWKIHYVRA